MRPVLQLVQPSELAPAGDASRTAQLLDEWETFGVAANWSPNTIGMRKEAFGLIARHAGVPLEEVTPLQLARFLAEKRAPATKATYYRHARSFYTWLHKSGYRGDDPSAVLPTPREPRSVPKPVTLQQLEGALAVAQRIGYAYILLAAYAGLRVHEVAKVRGEDLDVDARTIRVVGKGGHEAVLPMHRRIVAVTRGWPDSGFWFPGTHDGHVCMGTVSTSIKKAFARAGHDVHAHQLRHWFGTTVLRAAGGNLRVTQECMRHASPATTARYTQVENAELRAAIRGLPG